MHKYQQIEAIHSVAGRRIKHGVLDAVDIFSDPLLKQVWEDFGLTLAESGAKVGKRPEQICILRRKIKDAIRKDPDFKKKCRQAMHDKFAIFDRSVDNNLRDNNPAVTIAFGRGIGVLNEDNDPSSDTNTQDNDALIRRLCEIIAGVQLPKS